MHNIPFPTDDPRRDATDALSTLSSCLLDLAHHDPSVRTWAVIKLGELGDLRAVAPLTLALRDDDSDVRDEAFFALCTLRDPRAIPALFALLNALDMDIDAHYLYQALMSMHAQVVAHLISAIRDPDPEVYVAYARHLGEHCYYLVRKPRADAQYTQAVIDALLEACLNNCAEMRAALLCVSRFDDPRIRAVLLAGLRDDDDRVRLKAALGLRSRVKDSAELDAYLHDERAETREAALMVFMNTADMRNMPTILTGLFDPAAPVRVIALCTLRYRWQQYSSEIMETDRQRLEAAVLILVHDEDAAVRTDALLALSSMGMPQTRGIALAAITDPAARVRHAALLALQRAGLSDDAVRDAAIAGAHDSEPLVQNQAIQLLSTFPGPEVRCVLEQVMAGPDTFVARMAGRLILQRIENENELIAYADVNLQHRFPSIRFHILHKIAKTRHPRRVALLQSMIDDPECFVRRTAIAILLRQEGRSALAACLPHLTDPETSVRGIILDALETIGEIGDVPALIPHVADKNRANRQRARSILHQLTGEDFGTDVDGWQAWWTAHQRAGHP